MSAANPILVVSKDDEGESDVKIVIELSVIEAVVLHGVVTAANFGYGNHCWDVADTIELALKALQDVAAGNTVTEDEVSA